MSNFTTTKVTKFSNLFSEKKKFNVLPIVALIMAMMAIVSGVNAQTTIFSENVGTPTGTTTIANFATGTAPATFQNKGSVSFYASATSPDCRVTTNSASAYTGASGNGNVYFTTTNNIYFAISGINTSNYANIGLTLGFYHNTAAALTQTGFAIEYCTDYNSSNNTGTFTALTYTSTATTGWALLSPTGSLPASSTLTIRFTQKQTTQQVRIDDIKISGCSPTAVTSLSASAGDTKSTVQWTNPTCFDKTMVVVKSSAFTSATPSGTSYTANSASFTDAANGTFDGGKVVYFGTGSSVNVTSLTNGSTYNVKVFTLTGTLWSAATSTTASPVACSTPVDATSPGATNGNASSVLTWTNGSCLDKVMIVASSSAFTSATPSGTSYTANSTSFTDVANSSFDGGVVVYYGSASTATITGLTNGTSYNFKIFTVKGSTWGGSPVTTSAAPYLPAYYWNGGNTSANPAAGGTGSWGTANAWVSPTASGTSATWADGNNAIFAGTAGTVTLDANRTTTATYFNTPGYTLQAGATSTLTGPVYLNFNSGAAPYTLTVKPVTYTLTLPNGISTIGSNTGTVVLDGGSLGPTNYAILSLTGASQTISTPITVQATGNTAGSGTVGLVVSATGTYNVTGNITNNANTYLLLGGTSGGTLTVSGQISSSSYGIMYANKTAGGGAAPLYLNHNNNYTGSTLINGGGTNGIVYLGTDGALPSTTDVVMGYSSGNGGYLDINGHNPTINSISSVIASATVGVTNGASGTGTNTLTIAGTLTKTLTVPINDGTTAKTALAITGSGTLIQSQASTFSGGLSISGGGTFQAGVASVLTNTPALTLNNGTFSTGATTGFSTNIGALTVGANNGTISLGTGSHTLTIASSSANTWGAGNLTVNGWTRAANTATASAGKIIITASGLTSTQLGKISFTGFSGHAIFNPSSATELIPDYVDAVPVSNFGAATYNPSSSPAHLSVSPTCNSAAITGTATYQWYQTSSSSVQSPSTDTKVGTNIASYTPSVVNGGSSPITWYYYCVVTYNNYTSTTATSGAIVVNPAPSILVSALSNASNLTYIYAYGPSAVASFTISAKYLTGTGNITIDNGSSSALSYFELSTNYVAGANSGTWSGTATIPYNSATLGSTTVYVRLAAGQAINTYTETYMSVYGGGGSIGESGYLNGSVTASAPPVITTQPNITNSTSCSTGSAISVSVSTGTDPNPNYQWWYNTSASSLGAQTITNATASSYTPSITSQTLAGTGYYYYCTITDSYGSLVTSDFSGIITVNAPIAAASVSIIDNVTNHTSCSGNNVTFTATPTTNGGSPSYQWFVYNGTSWNSISGNSTNTFSTSSLTDQNQVKVVVTPTGGCLTDASNQTSNTITETVPATETASLTVAGATVSCKSTPLTFTASPSATPSNTYNVGGTGATYDWYLNSILQSSSHTNSFTYTTSNSATTDQVYAKLHTATGVCVTANLVTSTNTVNVAVSAAVPTVTTTSTGVVLYPGFTSTFTATASGSGTLNYQWTNNGSAISNNTNNNNTATSAAYTANSNDLTNNGTVNCIVTSSLGCSATASANITVSVPTPTAFTAGKIVVERTSGTSSAANNLFIDEYNTTGASQTPIMSVPLPYSVGTYPTSSSSSSNFSITTSGSATSEGYITLSTDGKKICVPGYNAYLGLSSVASTSTSAPSTNYRALGLVDVNGVATVPLAADFQSGNNLRSVVSDGTQIWFSGASGLYYFTSKDDNGAKTYASVNLRTMSIFNGKLYGSSASGSNIGINVLGDISALGDGGTSATETLITTGYPGTPSPYGFVFNPSGDVLYVADNNNGILKFSSTNGTSFAYQYTLNTTSAYGLIGDFSGANPVLFATAGTNLYSFTDAGNPGTATATTSSIVTLATTATQFKGLAWSPAVTQNSYVYVDKNYLGNSFSGDFANTYAGTPTTTLTTTGKVNSFAIAGNFLSNAVVITPDAGFEVSLDPSFGTYATNSAPLTIANSIFDNSQTTSIQTVYVRFKPTTAGTTYSNTYIRITSSGSSEVDVPVTGTSNAASDYYYVGTGSLTATSSWTINSNLSAGTPPPSMDHAGITWHLTNAKSVSLTTSWSLGSNARVIVGDGTHIFNLTVPSGDAITGGLGIEVANASSLIWQDASNTPLFTVLDNGSTVNYAATTAQSISAAAYSNLTLSSTGAKIFSGTYSINNTFTAGTSTITTTGSTITFNGTLAQYIPGITYNNLVISNAAGATLSGNTVSGNLTISSGTLHIPNTKSLTVNGTAVALSSSTSVLDIAGTFNNGTAGATAATFTQATGSSVNCNYSTTIYNHSGNGGSIPKATWNAASNCSITGITSTNPTSASFAQNFGKFTWNNSGQTTALNINTSSFATQGLLDIEGTGSSNISLASGLSNSYTYSINSLTVNNAKFYTCVRTSSVIPTVALTVAGNILIGGTATVDLANGYSSSATTYNTTLNAGGDIIVGSSATLIASNKNGTVINGAKIIFNKSGAQTYTNASATGNIDFIINAGSTVTLGANLTQSSSSTPNDYINNSGVFNLGGYLLTCGNLNSANNQSSGLIVANNGSITINGTTSNTLNFRATAVNDTLLASLTLSGSSTTKLGTKLGITKLLNISNSSAILDINGNHLYLKSNATETAEVAAVYGLIKDGTKSSPYTATNITVERYIPQGRRNYRDIAPTVANAGSVFANWQEGGVGSSTYSYGVYITGKTGTPGFSNFSSKYGFDYTTNGNTTPSLYSCIGGTWHAVDTSVSNPIGGSVLGSKGWYLDPFQGLRLLVRGGRNFNMGFNPTSMPTATTLRATGTLITGDVTYNAMSSTNGIANIATVSSAYNSTYGLTAGGGWSFVANPYACPIGWDKILADNGNGSGALISTYYFLDPYYQNQAAGSSYGLQRYVTVQYNSTTGNTIVTNRPSAILTNDSCKYIQPGQGFWVYHNTTSTPTLLIKESHKIVGHPQTSVFGSSKPANMLSASIWKDVNGVSTNVDGTIAIFNNNFTKSIGNEDSKKLMNSGENISITELNNDLSIDGIAPPTEGDVIALKLGNVIANTTYQLQLDATQFAVPGIQAYIKDAYFNTEVPASTVVNFTPTTDTVTYKDRFSVVFKKVAVVPVAIVKGKISVYPNPVTEQSFTLQTMNIASGKYHVLLVNNLGQEVLSTEITHKEGSSSEIITMNKTLPSGIYTIALRSEEGKGVYQTELLAK